MEESFDPSTLLLDRLVRQRKAIVVADVVESVRLMGQDEAGFITAWLAFVRNVRDQLLPAHRGTLVKSLGDGLLMRFDSPTDAVAASLNLVAATSIPLRVGVHTAEIVMDDLDIYGRGVNLAARLASLARPSQVVVSAEIRDAIGDGVHAEVIDLGECYLKHVDAAVRAFALHPLRAQASLMPAAVPLEPAMAATVAVVPFDGQSGAGNSEVVGYALADAVIDRLYRLPGLRLIARLSTARMAREPDLVEACRVHLGAHFVVTGTFHCISNRVRGVVKAIDTRTHAMIWADGFEIELTALFQDTDAALLGMVQGLSRALFSHAVRRARQMPVPNLESFALYLGGVTLLHRLGRDDFARSRQLLQALCERHPRAAAPLAMLAKWHMLRVLQGWSDDPVEEGRRGLALAIEALDKEPEHPVALSMSGLLGVHFGDDLVSALSIAERAVQADPQEPGAWMTLAGIESYLARGDTSAEHAQRATLLSPLDPCRFLFELLRGAGQLVAGRTEEALESIRASIRLNAMHAPTYRLAVISHMLAGHPTAARDAARRLLVLDPRFRVSTFAERYPGRNQAHAADYVSALRDAGLPG
jgi:class 3 adenylate cyclase